MISDKVAAVFTVKGGIMHWAARTLWVENHAD